MFDNPRHNTTFIKEISSDKELAIEIDPLIATSNIPKTVDVIMENFTVFNSYNRIFLKIDFGTRRVFEIQTGFSFPVKILNLPLAKGDFRKNFLFCKNL